MLIIIIPLVIFIVSIYGILVAKGTINPIGYKVKDPDCDKDHWRSEWYRNNDTEGLEFTSWICAVLFGAWLVVDLCCFINLNRQFDATILNHEYLTEQVEAYNTGNCDAYVLIGGETSLSDKVIQMNKDINHHKTRLGSAWNGVYMSEDIASLSIIVFNKNPNK